MTKKEIVRLVSDRLKFNQQQTKEAVQATFDVIIDVLAEKKKIELRNFGVFKVKRRAPRTARNPVTNETVDVPERFVVVFKPGKEMEKKVQNPASKKKKRTTKTVKKKKD